MDEDVWAGLSSFQAVSFTQRFLKACYHRSNIEQSDAKSYRNSYPFLYYLQHGQRHYKLADSAPLELQPLLLFYGMTQLIKACLLTVDPDYPKTTSVLAHGVSTRKRKKKNYAFSDDEVRIQKNGLTAHFSSRLFDVEQLEGSKFSMLDLLERIPDLNDLFAEIHDRPPFYPIVIKDGRKIDLPSRILDDLHMTCPRFGRFLETQTHQPIKKCEETKGLLQLVWEKAVPPFPTSLSGGFYAPRNRDHYDRLPEMLVHFLLLYNLSMIARYETEWWSELFQQAADDLPFIQLFLKVTKEKVPLLASRYLHELRKG